MSFMKIQLKEPHHVHTGINYIIFMHGHIDVCMKNVCAVLYVYLHPIVKFMSINLVVMTCGVIHVEMKRLLPSQCHVK
jgi:hypothetical protein